MPDTRPLPPEPGYGAPPETGTAADGGLRWDALRGEWVVIAAAAAGPDVPAAHRSVPARPVPPRAADRDPGAGLRRGGVREPVPLAARRGALAAAGRGHRGRLRRRIDPGGLLEYGGVPPQAGYGRCEVVCFTSDHNGSFAKLSPRRARTVVEAWADRTAALNAHGRRRPGLLLREPRRGDRRHPAPPARADLRLPVRHPADGHHAGPGRPVHRPDRPEPVRRPGRRARSRRAPGS